MASNRGVRQFTVGTGGKSLRPQAISNPPAPNSQTAQGSTAGPLFLTLRPGSYDWDFAGVAGGHYDDRGRATCVTGTRDAQDLPVPRRSSAKLSLLTRRARVTRKGVVAREGSLPGNG